MISYKHKVQYYETDKMGITHHSNYIRWFEEARVNYLDKIGYNFAKLEESGITSPVVNVECDYKKTTTFDDEVDIVVRASSCKGAKFSLNYIVTKGKDVVCKGSSSHCFINSEGRVMRIQKELPKFYNILISDMENNSEKI